MFLDKLPKATGPSRKRIGRGPGSGVGKTCGKGHKGSKARSGAKRKSTFEGGQPPLHRRLPKFGFTSRNRKIYQLINLKTLEKDDRVVSGESINKDQLQSLGMIKSSSKMVKLLAEGDLTKSIKISLDAASRQAEKSVKDAGGEVILES